METRGRHVALHVIEDIRALGIELRADETGEKLLFRPKSLMSLDLYRRLHEHKQEILAVLVPDDSEVAWRVVAMRPQVPVRGPIPFLVARSSRLAVDAPGRCLSCGDALGEGQKMRCSPCVRAIQLVLDEVREGVQLA
jgi:hypothetical protein